MISKIVAILLLCVSVFLYMTNTQIVENLNGIPEDITGAGQTGSALNTSMGNNGYHFQNYFPISGTPAYKRGGTTTIETPGPKFITRARLGLNSARGGDVILCTGKTQPECNGDSSCVWAEGNICKNTFQNLNQSYNVEAYVEKQFENGTMGAPYIKDEIRRKNKGLNSNFNDDNDESNGVDNFGIKNNNIRTRENLTHVQNGRKGDIVGALRGEVKITQNTKGYCPSVQISKTLGGGQSYSCSAITGMGSDNDPLYNQSQREKNGVKWSKNRTCDYNCERNY